MDGFIWIVLIGIAIWILSNSERSNGSSSNSSSTASNRYPETKASPQAPITPIAQYPRSSNVIKDGFQPDDQCSCGGSWIKRENRETGGRFFSCSRYPTCKNSRDQVLKARLGSQYSEIYCTRGHHKPTSGTIFDYQRGKDVCKKCVEKGYVALR